MSFGEFYGALGSLGDTFRTAQEEAQRKRAVTQLGVQPNDPQFLPKLGQALIGLGDVNGALAVSRLVSADSDRAYQRTRDASSDAFRERAFNTGREDVTYDRNRQGKLDNLTEYYRDKADKRADEQFGIQKEAATRKQYPEGFEADPNVPGAIRAIPNGPRDPAYIGSVKAAENDAKGAGVTNNPYAVPGGGKTTGEQDKSAGFADRMFENERVVRPLESIGTSRVEQGLEARYVPGFVGSTLHSNDFKSYKTAKDNWIAAQLRKESGAAIGQGEYDAADRQYFPQPGDPPNVIEQKRQLRRTATEGMARDGGPSYVPKYTFGQDGAPTPYSAPERPAPRAAAPAQAATVNNFDAIPEGRRFRAPNGKVYRKVNGQAVPE